MCERLAEVLNHTVFISPRDKALQYFDISALVPSFCVSISVADLPVKLHKSMSVKPVTVHSYSLMWNHFRGRNDLPLLPNETDPAVRHHHADVLLTFYAALFGGLKNKFVEVGTNYLQHFCPTSGPYQYVAIQKRHFENHCAYHLHHSFKYSDFSQNDFDKNTPAWELVRSNNFTTSIVNFHPLCNMTQEVIFGAQKAHGLVNLSSYVLLTDSQEPVPDFMRRLKTCVRSELVTEISGNGRKNATDGADLMVDIFLGLHAALLIRNPYSTLTLPLDVLRVIWNLPTSSLDHSSVVSLTVQGSWFTMADVEEVISRRNLQALY